MRGSRRLHTDAVIAALKAAGLTVDDGTRVSDPPVVVVYRLPINDDGYLDEPERDFDGTYQLTCVSTGREDAEWLEDKALDAVKNLSVVGRSVLRIHPDGGMGPRLDEDANDRPWYSTPTVRVRTTPA